MLTDQQARAIAAWNDNEEASGSCETGIATAAAIIAAFPDAAPDGPHRNVVHAAAKLIVLYTTFGYDTDGEATSDLYDALVFQGWEQPGA